MCKWLREMGLPLKLPSNFLITTGAVYEKYMTALSLSSHPWAQLGRENILSGHMGKAEREAVRCCCRHGVNTACFGAVWEGSHPLTPLLQFTLSSCPCTMSKLSCFILERGRERKVSNVEVCWSNEMCLILEEQGQACKLCHCSVCSVTREGQGCEKQLQIVSVCIEESWQLSCPVGVTRYTTGIFPSFHTSVIFTYPAAEGVITLISETWKYASECKRGKMDWFWLW